MECKGNQICRKSNLIYNPTLNCYEFAVTHKIIGETLSITKSNMFGMLSSKRKCVGFLYIKISVIVTDNIVILKSRHYKSIAQQHPVSFKVCPDYEYSLTPFIVKDGNMSMCESFEKSLQMLFTKHFRKLLILLQTSKFLTEMF